MKKSFRQKEDETVFVEAFAAALNPPNRFKAQVLAEALAQGKSVYEQQFNREAVTDSIQEAHRSARVALARRGEFLGVPVDCLGECWQRMWHALPKYDNSGGPFQAYAVTVCKNLMRDNRRRKKKEQTVSFPSLPGLEAASEPLNKVLLFSSSESLSEEDFKFLREIDLRDRIRLVVNHRLGARISEDHRKEWTGWCRDLSMTEDQISETFGVVEDPAKFLADAWGLNATSERQSSWRRSHWIVYMPWFWKSLEWSQFEQAQVDVLLALEPVEDRLVCSCVTPNWYRLHSEAQLKALHQGRCRSKNFPWLLFTKEKSDHTKRIKKLSQEMKIKTEDLQQRWGNLQGLRQLLEVQP